MKLDTSMSFRATTLRRSTQFVFLALLLAAPAFAQAPNSPIIFANQEAITVSFVKAPNISTENSSYSGGSDETTQWLKVEFHYAVQPATGDFLDSAEFKIWIEGRDLLATDAPTKEGIAVGFTGSVTYVNIPKGKDQYGVFYVHPSTLARYNTGLGPTDFDRKFNIHIEAFVGGAKMDYFDKKKEPDLNWYQQLRAIPGLVYRQNQTPFIVSDSARYPAIKLPDNATQ